MPARPEEQHEEAKPAAVWTIGHSVRSWEDFLALLRSQSIEALADVRRFAGSRRNPQLAQPASG